MPLALALQWVNLEASVGPVAQGHKRETPGLLTGRLS